MAILKLKSVGSVPKAIELGRTVQISEKRDKLISANACKPLIVFSQMRSGSTYLLRLINQACERSFISEEITTIQHLVGIYEGILENKPKEVCRLGYIQPGEDAPWEYDCVSKNERLFKLFWYAMNTLGYNHFSFKCTSFAVNGYEEVSEKFIKMLDFFYGDFTKHYSNLLAVRPKIVWLVRDSKDILHSIRTTKKINEKLCHLPDEDLIRIFDKQRKQFKMLVKPEDLWVTYEELQLNPQYVLKEMGLEYDPEIVKQVEKLKVR